MSLACGGRGPCCHIGYPHRHCEHCDVVVALACHHHGYSIYPSTQPWWYATYSSGLQSQLGNTQQQLLANQFHQLTEASDAR
jgi:hypothetical protein